jgi:hypothetical protein
VSETFRNLTASVVEFEAVLRFLKSHQSDDPNVNSFADKVGHLVDSSSEDCETEIIFPLLDLPEGPIVTILSNLPVSQLLEFSTCNRLCKKLSESNDLWKNQLLRNFPEISEFKTPKLNEG